MAVPGVTTPEPVAFELIRHVTALLGLYVPITDALNCKVLPAVIVWFEGETVTLVTVGLTTETETMPYFVESIIEKAIT